MARPSDEANRDALDLNRALWTAVNAEFTDVDARRAWAADEWARQWPVEDLWVASLAQPACREA